MTTGTIIVLNGTSSSGKTSIARALQDLFEVPYLDAGLDRFLWMLPRRYLDRPLWDEVLGLASEAGPTGHRLVAGMHQALVSLARTGNNVVADHVLVEPLWLRECAGLLAGLPAYLVGVRCPLEVLEQRERARRDRTLGQAAAQFPLVHAHGIYDLEVDTSVSCIDACARQIKERVESGAPPVAFARLHEQFALNGAGLGGS
jgi:chloramphenicol 3-O phosphotransferase